MRRLGKIFILVGAMILAFYYVYNKSLEYKNNDDIKNYIEETSGGSAEFDSPAAEGESQKEEAQRRGKKSL